MNKNILIVEDDENLLDMYKEMLKKYFQNILIAKDGEEGMEVFRHHRPTVPVVLFDLNLPKLDGLTMARKMLELSPMTQFVLITAHLDDSCAAEAMSLGIFCLPKPVDQIFVRLTTTKAFYNYEEGRVSATRAPSHLFF